MGFAFWHVDVVLSGDTIFFIFRACFSSFAAYPPARDSGKIKITIYFHAQSFLCTYETGFLWKKKKKAACERVINNYIIAKTGKGQIKVAEGPLIPAFPSYRVLRYAVLVIFSVLIQARVDMKRKAVLPAFRRAV